MTVLERIEALKIEAGGAGDKEMIAICRRALAGSARARIVCLRVLAEAEAEAAFQAAEEAKDVDND
jgi:hypothetical protein